MEGFVPISAVFYVVFHPTEGTKVVHQVPSGSIVPPSSRNDSSSLETPLFDFATVKNYVIPKPQLCDRLVTFKIDQFRVIGYPVNIINPNYARNSFSFNFCFVFPYDSDTTPYEQAIKRMGKMFRVLEEQSQLLSKQNKMEIFYKPKHTVPTKEEIVNLTYHEKKEDKFDDDTRNETPGQNKTRKVKLSSIESLVQQMYQDLNNYSECLIPLDSANSVDIKLFPLFPPPPNINSSDVPITTVKLKSLVDLNWDPTMVKILPFINGINSIKRISQLADADYLLTKQCIQHLMHYKCIVMLDIFQFSNIYSTTNKIGAFLEDNMAAECQAYVFAPNPLSKLSVNGSSSDQDDARSIHSLKSQLLLHSSSSKSLNRESDLKNFTNNYHTISEFIPTSVSPLSRPSYLRSNNPSISNTSSKDSNQEQIVVPSKATLFLLYRSLSQGITVKEWYLQHRDSLKQIDIRRFLSFGVLRGIIYRIHGYPIMENLLDSIEVGDDANVVTRDQLKRSDSKTSERKMNYKNRSIPKFMSATNEAKLELTNKDTFKIEKRKVSFNDSARLNQFRGLSALDKDDFSDVVSDFSSDDDYDNTTEQHRKKQQEKEEMEHLIKLLKKFHNYDTICTELQKPKAEVEKMISKIGDFNQVNS